MQFGEAWKRGLIPAEELLGSLLDSPSPFDGSSPQSGNSLSDFKLTNLDDPRVAGIKAIAWQRCKDG